MNLQKLFDMQKVLDDRITKKHNLDKKHSKTTLILNRVLALIVEGGECANEWRRFKFWSEDQEPRTRVLRYPAMMEEDKEYYNPLLEEYVDGIHFVISLGLEISYDNIECFKYHKQKKESITEQFILVTKWAACLLDDDYYFELFHAYIHLGEMLGFTWEQIEQAYMDKNKVNHQRQESGY